MLAVLQPAPGGLHPTETGSASLQLLNFRGSFDVVHFHYGPLVPLHQLPTPPRGDAVDVAFRREQPNSTGGTLTHVPSSFPGATSVNSVELTMKKVGQCVLFHRLRMFRLWCSAASLDARFHRH